MKMTYIQPEIWVEELDTVSQLLATSNEQVINVIGYGIGYGGGGSGGARAGENHLWDDDEEEDSGWDDL